MSVGDALWPEHYHPAIRFLTRILGVSDVHSHFRTRPLTRWLRDHASQLRGATVVEIGCGVGLNILELLKATRLGFPETIDGFDLDREAIQIAERWKNRRIGPDIINFHNQLFDAIAVSKAIDLMLLIDVIEHIHEPIKFLKQVEAALAPGATLLISVPTHRYPQVFGRRFHLRIGHVRDGFTIQEISSLMLACGFQVKRTSYNTGLIASLACYFYYQHFERDTRFKLIAGFCLSLFRWLDFFNGPSLSCSMFVVACKENKLDQSRRTAEEHLSFASSLEASANRERP